MSLMGLGRVKTPWRGDLIEWIVFSIANFAAKIVMRDGFSVDLGKTIPVVPELARFSHMG